MSDDLRKRVNRLETLLEEQQGANANDQATSPDRRERPATRDSAADFPADSQGATRLNRRDALKTGGLLALLFGSAGAANADPQGQVGSSSDPLNTLYTEEVNGPVTDGQPLNNIAGANLEISEGELQWSKDIDEHAPDWSIYMTIEDDQGNSLTDGASSFLPAPAGTRHEDEVKVLAIDHEINVPIDDRTGARTGDPRHKLLNLYTYRGKQTPLILDALAQNTSATVTLEFYDKPSSEFLYAGADSEPVHIFTTELEGAKIAYMRGFKTGIQKIGLTYDSIAMTHVISSFNASVQWNPT